MNKEVIGLFYELWMNRRELEGEKNEDIKDFLRRNITFISNQLYNLKVPSVCKDRVLELAINGEDFTSNIKEILESIDLNKKPNLKKGSLKMSYMNERYKIDKTGKIKLLKFQGTEDNWEWWIVKNIESDIIYSYAFYIPGRKRREVC